MLKTCVRCGGEKPLTDFVKDKRRKDGRGSICLQCHRNAEKDRTSTPKGKLLKSLADKTYRQDNAEDVLKNKRLRSKEGSDLINSSKCVPCKDCGKTFPPECMELDHIDDDKIMNVSAMKNMNRDKIIEEIAKCEVVCSVCHRIRTESRRNPSEEKRLLEHRAMINEFKSKSCADCGLCYPPVAMDLDHVRGEKILEISNMGHYPRHKVLKELDKCDVVCACCHRIRTKMRQDSK